ncbi:hypothetical protein AV530_006397 [Patagioenas fasciata monilis]|uniref:Uncharacterized protein n=1 Tax=Patagioenas fasciata monilis TaxID=372326 RepID=A0A1V4KGD4_PATFA|nr:hypothetical protein AV530_006397 [Patagioenas fasciata monilis]
MDNASDYGSEDCRFDSCLARKRFGASVRLAWPRFLSPHGAANGIGLASLSSCTSTVQTEQNEKDGDSSC